MPEDLDKHAMGEVCWDLMVDPGAVSSCGCAINL